MIPQAMEWRGGALHLLDQTRLPDAETWIECRDDRDVAEAIRRLAVRGAPAIGCAAAYGVVLGVRAGRPAADAVRDLGRTRPTAVNLFWALERMKRAAERGRNGGTPARLDDLLEAEAVAIHADDAARCRRIAEHGLALVPDGATVLTHCHAGALATGGIGTALGILHLGRERGRRFRVFADETRPLRQGARITAWELARAGIDVTVICDGMAAHVVRDKGVDLVLVGADRIAANGDVANKIGTYAVALAARAHGAPFYVAAPLSTVDLACPDGASIPIEERPPDEVGAAPGARVYNPAFDVTPADLVAAIVTDAGVAQPPFRESLARLAGAAIAARP